MRITIGLAALTVFALSIQSQALELQAPIAGAEVGRFTVPVMSMNQIPNLTTPLTAALISLNTVKMIGSISSGVEGKKLSPQPVGRGLMSIQAVLGHESDSRKLNQTFNKVFDNNGNSSEDSWWDGRTGQYETESSKIGKAHQMALSHPLAAAINNGLKRRVEYQVSRSVGATVVTEGDDPEDMTLTLPSVIFGSQALRTLSVEYLASKLSSLWVRHLYRETMHPSAEKTYVEGSVMVRVFMDLTGSWAGGWNKAKDRPIVDSKNGQTNSEVYEHFYWWNQGFNYKDVRQGPYFTDKIMGNQGSPVIETDDRGRKTLFQRAHPEGGGSGPLLQDAVAAEGQEHFQNFVDNERQAQDKRR